MVALGVEALTSEQEVLALLETANRLGESRYIEFAGRSNKGVRERWFVSGDYQLTETNGACGSFTAVFVRLMQRAGYDVRIAQMFCMGFSGCHILAEVNVDGRWVPCDPLFNVAFHNPDGQLATFDEIGADWEYYRTQAPDDYDFEYDYEGVRRTNWDKYPLVMRPMKSALNLVFGEEEADAISLRTYFMNIYWVYTAMLLVAYLFVIILSVLSIRSHRRRRIAAAAA